MDLLLHLARTGGIDLTAVPMAEVARQCDEYLALLGGQSLEVAGDHLVMAATLVHLKSRSLLPPDPAEALAVAEDEESLVPGPESHRLAVKRAAEQLQEREAVMELVFSRPAERVAEFAGEQGIEADLFALLNAFQTILRRAGENPAARVTRERLSLAERIGWLMDRLTRERRVAFRSLFGAGDDRLGCILTFLALLEVMRLRLARAYSSHHHEDIMIVLAEDVRAADTPSSEVRADA
jgi:segregation and condensation protein A